jgi:small subunit ribosomal protein S20
MANHKSSEKRHRQSLKRRDRNRVVRASVRTVFKQAQAALQGKDAKAKELCVAAERAIAKAASKGIISKNTAARKISRLTIRRNKAA